jgi:hypothetical protein
MKVTAFGTYDFKKMPQCGLGVSNRIVMRWNVSKPGGDPL